MARFDSRRYSVAVKMSWRKLPVIVVGSELLLSVSFKVESQRLLASFTVKNHHLQGGAVNHGLFFAGPQPSPLGAVSGKISENRWAAA
jgi:hypothetical protein